MYQIGVDIGGTNIKVGLVNETMELVQTCSVRFPHDGARSVVKTIEEAVDFLLRQQAIARKDVESVGIVVPGSIDQKGERVIDAYNLGFHDVPLKALAQEAFGEIPVYLANDANGAALAELYAGGSPENVDAKLVIDCAKEGDETAKAVFDQYIDSLSSACASIYNLLDPEVIAIGGGVCGAGEFLFAPLREKTTGKCFYKTHGKLVPAELGNDAGMIGAAMLHKDAQ